MEKWPYPNLPVYVLCPRDGEGCSQTLHRNYLLPISSNIEQDKKDTPVAGGEHTNTSTPVPPVDSEPIDAGPSGMVSLSTSGNTCPRVVWIHLLHLDAAHEQPRTDSHGGTRNFGLLADTSLSWHLGCFGWSVYLPGHITSCLYTIFWGSTVWTHSTYSTPCLLSTTYFGIEENFLNVVFMVEFWMEGVDQKIIWFECNCPTRKIQKE